MNTILHGDCIAIMAGLPAQSVDLIFADPPFNIGLKYEGYADKLTAADYSAWSKQWVAEAFRLLKPTGSIYVAIGDEFAAELNVILKAAGFTFRNWLIWFYTFGQNQKRKFARCKTHILYFSMSDQFIFNADAIAVPSARQLVYGDKRAAKGGKTPPDVWPVFADAGGQPHDLGVWPADWEVWNDPRLCGTFAERLVKPDGSAHPCQMPLSVLHRVILASSNVGDLVLDPFSGTGTTAVAAAMLGRRYISIDQSAEYVSLGLERLGTGLAAA